jgi:hypothetical protein
VAAIGVAVVGGFFPPDPGCRVFPPLGYGIDLAALCLANQDRHALTTSTKEGHDLAPQEGIVLGSLYNRTHVR